MNFRALTFGQLYRLNHPSTILKLMQGAVRARRAGLPDVALRYRRFKELVTSFHMRQWLRSAANNQQPIPTPGAPLELCCLYVLGRTRKATRALADIIVRFCALNGIVAYYREFDSETRHKHRFEIRAETGPLGCQLLTYKSGMMWHDIAQMCFSRGVDPLEIFGWVPDEVRHSLTFDKTRVNPLNWPMNTPGSDQIARELVGLA